MTGFQMRHPYAAQGRRLRILRLAERVPNGLAFAQKLGWLQSGYSQFETGARQIPIAKVQAMYQKIPGFDAQWLWHNDKRNLGFDLRRRIEEIEDSEAPSAPVDNHTSSGGATER